LFGRHASPRHSTARGWIQKPSVKIHQLLACIKIQDRSSVRKEGSAAGTRCVNELGARSRVADCYIALPHSMSARVAKGNRDFRRIASKF
jgi:hypothetical protein